MKIEYVLTESNQKSPNKKRIKDLVRRACKSLNTDTIIVQPNRNEFELEYNIKSQKTNSENNNDIVYHFVVTSDHPKKDRQAINLEYFNTKFKAIIDSEKDYHFIIAYDGVSEYYCNKAYPKYQRFERQLRHLIFKVVTKSYGNLWTSITMNAELKNRLKKDIPSQKGIAKSDLLIEQALYEMSLGQLIDYLFYAESTDFYEELDNNYPTEKLSSLSKEELIDILEKARKPSVWNTFLAKEITVDQPITKLNYLKENRNKVAHCKFFYKADYELSLSYLDTFTPEIEKAIENNAIIEALSSESIFLGFSNYGTKISETIAKSFQPLLSSLGSYFSELQESISYRFLDSFRDVINAAKLSMPNLRFDNPLSDSLKLLTENNLDYLEDNKSEEKQPDQNNEELSDNEEDDTDKE